MSNNLLLTSNGGNYIISLSSTSSNGVLKAPPSMSVFNPSDATPGVTNNSDFSHGVTSITPYNPTQSNSINPKTVFYTYTLKYLQYDNIKSLLDFTGVPYTYAPMSKTIIFKDSGELKKFIPKVIKQLEELDILKKQITLRITIFEVNINKLKTIGFDPNLNFDFSLLSQTGSLLSGSAVSSFKGSLAFLENNGVTTVSSSTSYLVADSEQLDFRKVVNLPFKDENYAVTNQNATNQTVKYSYKPIGFKVLCTPTIVNDLVYLDFDLKIEDVLSNSDQLPTTSENSIKNKFSINKGDIVLLAGINKKSINDKDNGLPFLNKLPFISSLFNQTSNTGLDQTFNISIEVLNDK